MKPIIINRESVPQRCEICHQTDCFVPEQNYCARCQGIIPREIVKNSITTRAYCPPVSGRQRIVAGSCFALASLIPIAYFWGTLSLLFSYQALPHNELPLWLMLPFTLLPFIIAGLVGGRVGVRILTPPPNATRNYARRIGGQVALWSYLYYTLLLASCAAIFRLSISPTYDSSAIICGSILFVIICEVLFWLLGGIYILWLIILANRGAAYLLDKFGRAKGLTLIPESTTRIKLTSSSAIYE